MNVGYSGHHSSVRFAVNFSTPTEALVGQGSVGVDLLKCPAWPDVVARANATAPAYVHFPLMAGHLGPERQPADLDLVEELYRATATPHVNTHLDPQLGPTALRMLQWDDALRRVVDDVSHLVARFGAQHVVVENVPFWTNKDLHIRLAAEPWFIRRVLEETGAGLLLDLAHARIAAQSLGMDEREYVCQLPVGRLRELHVTGIGVRDGWLRDHLPMTDADWLLFDWAVDCIREHRWARPRIVAFEYGGIGERFKWRTDPEVLAAQIPRLYEGVRRMSAQGAISDAA